MGKVKDISVDNKARISTLLETGNYMQQEIARIKGVARQIVQGIAYLIIECIPQTSSGSCSCSRRAKMPIQEDRHIIEVAAENLRLPIKGTKE